MDIRKFWGAAKNSVVAKKDRCTYRCTHGKHEGELLADVVRTDRRYINFLLKEHRHTFPKEFCNALRECGVDVDQYHALTSVEAPLATLQKEAHVIRADRMPKALPKPKEKLLPAPTVKPKEFVKIPRQTFEKLLRNAKRIQAATNGVVTTLEAFVSET